MNDQHPGQVLRTRTVLWATDDVAFATGRMYQQLADYAGGITVEVHRAEVHALDSFCLPCNLMARLLRNGDVLPAEPV